MLETIELRLMEVLAGDARIWRGGSPAYWTGVERNAVTPTAGFVHIYDEPFEMDDEATQSTGIYAGARGNGGSDEEEFPSIAGGLQEFRLAKVPLYLVVAVDPAGLNFPKQRARAMWNQLRANVSYILLDYIIDRQNGTWYKLERPGQKAGGDMRCSVTISASGGGSQGVVRAIGVLPVAAHYQFVAGGNAA